MVEKKMCAKPLYAKATNRKCNIEMCRPPRLISRIESRATWGHLTCSLFPYLARSAASPRSAIPFSNLANAQMKQSVVSPTRQSSHTNAYSQNKIIPSRGAGWWQTSLVAEQNCNSYTPKTCIFILKWWLEKEHAAYMRWRKGKK